MKYQYLKELRNKVGVSTKEIAKGIGISSAYYSQIENGRRRLTYILAVKIATYFNMKPDEIFYLDEQKDLKL